MSSQKRLLLFFVLSFAMVLASEALMRRLGLIPPPRKPDPVADAAPNPAVPNNAAPALAKADPAPADAKPGVGVKPPEIKAPRKPDPERVKLDELVLGADNDPDPRAYHLRLRLDQVGAGVLEVFSARYDGETADGIPDRKSRLAILKLDPFSRAPTSFAMTLQAGGRPLAEGALPTAEAALDRAVWEVVRERPGGPVVRPVSKPTADGGRAEGQEVAFRLAVDDPKVTVVKRYRLYKGEDGFEVALTFDAAGDLAAKVAYRLFGPHGIPIEGESYTANFRDVFFGQIKGSGIEIPTRTAADVVKANKSTPETFTALPLKFAGVEDQYFAVFLEPDPTPTARENRIKQAMAFVAREDGASPGKSDVGVELMSNDFDVAPGRPVTHDYKVFAGPKTVAALTPYGAAELASYRKYQLFSIPFASTLAQNVIAPLLERIYTLTAQVARAFGGTSGSYGVAIILLTMTVRLCMFPLGRKQAMIAKKMQDLQPHLAAIKEKFKDNKEEQTRATMALYKEHGFNPAAGCLPSLIQLPIFVGLWQALNNSVALRHSTFLYIKNLAAPDMLFPFPTELPVVGRYFNLLPFLVVGLMLIQTKLFTPPPMTEEARMQQKMMKYMMIFMAFMFYRVPSGLGIYFITSSLWQVCERLLLPKLSARKQARLALDGDGASAAILPAPKPAGGVNGWLSRKLEKLLEEANNERTIRNNGGNGARDPNPDRNRNRPKPGKRR